MTLLSLLPTWRRGLELLPFKVISGQKGVCSLGFRHRGMDGGKAGDRVSVSAVVGERGCSLSCHWYWGLASHV